MKVEFIYLDLPCDLVVCAAMFHLHGQITLLFCAILGSFFLAENRYIDFGNPDPTAFSAVLTVVYFPARPPTLRC